VGRLRSPSLATLHTTGLTLERRVDRLPFHGATCHIYVSLSVSLSLSFSLSLSLSLSLSRSLPLSQSINQLLDLEFYYKKKCLLVMLKHMCGYFHWI